MISYSRAQAEASLGFTFRGLAGNLASRDARLLIVVIGAVSGQGLTCLALIAVLSNGVVFWRLAVARSHSSGICTPERRAIRLRQACCSPARQVLSREWLAHEGGFELCPVK